MTEKGRKSRVKFGCVLKEGDMRRVKTKEIPYHKVIIRGTEKGNELSDL